MATYEEWLFAGTLDDLKDKLASKNTYQALMISGLLRKLLLDDRINLLEKVNRNLKQEVLFQFVPQAAPGPGTTLWGAMDGLDGLDHAEPRGLIEAPARKFLAQPILQLRDDVFDVKDVIRHVAHVMGGVHAGNPTAREGQILKQLEPLHVGGAPILVRSILSVGRITHRALMPLRKLIVASDRTAKVDETRQRLRARRRR